MENRCASCENCRHNTIGDYISHCKPCIGQKQKNWEAKNEDEHSKGISGGLQKSGLQQEDTKDRSPLSGISFSLLALQVFIECLTICQSKF